MELPLQITWRHIDPSAAVEERVKERAQKLVQHFPEISHIHCVLEEPHRSQHKGNHYVVRLDIRVPGTDVVVGREDPDESRQTDLYAAITDTFDLAERRLRDRNGRKQKHSSKRG